MKRIVLISSLLLVLGSIHGQDIFKKHGFNKEPLTLSKGRYKETFVNADVMQIGTVLIDTRTEKVIQFLEEDTVGITYKAEATSRFLTIDPMAEKYPWISPYVYCLNNPIRFIDPDGRDVYRYDKKSGDLILEKKTDDKFDQIGKFSYDKESGSYTLKTNKSGEAKTHIDNIEKGILKDGVNFKSKDQVIAVGGAGEASIGGFESFVSQFSDFVGKEINGYYLSEKGTDDIKYVGVAHYSNNVRDESKGVFSLYRARPDLLGKVDQHTDFHTHPSNASESNKLYSSEQDKLRKANMIKYHPQIKRFIILTTGNPPIKY